MYGYTVGSPGKNNLQSRRKLSCRMLSPGKWHEHVPKDPVENVRFRLDLLERARGDLAFQAAILEICRQDIFFYINTFVWQYNPKHVGDEVGPFLTWPFQETAVRRTLRRLFKDGRRILWEKSRELGATWL